MKSLRWLCLGFVFGISVVGCGSKDPQVPETISKLKAEKFVFITNSDSPFWDAAEKGFSDFAVDRKAKVQFLRNKSADEAGQIRILDSLLAQSDVKGVAISVISANAVGVIDRLKELKNKGVAVLTVDSDCAKSDASVRLAYIGTNNLQAGVAAGEVAKLLVPEGGKVIGFVGNSDADNAKQRIEGFKKGAGEKLVLADVLQDNVDQNRARENVRTALLKNKDLKIPFGIYSYNAPAIAEVVSASGKRAELKVVTFDAEVNTMKAIKAGLIDATIVQNTYDMGIISAKLLLAMALSDTETVKSMLNGGDQFDTGVRVIVPDNSPLKGKLPNIQTHSEFEKYMNDNGLKST